MAGNETMSSGSPDNADIMRRSQVADSIVGGQAQIVRQQEQIRYITEENEQLKKEIVNLSGTKYDYVKADKLATLQGEVDALERRYQYEKMRKNDLTKRYQLARIDLLHSRKMKGGVNVEKEQAEAVQRQVDILENRLDQALGKFNDALSFNKELRDQIDIIREERRVFQRVHRKMEEDLRSKKRLMAERIEQSNKDMDERDEYLRQTEQIRQAIAEQQKEYKAQLREMDQAMEEIKTTREEQTNMELELEAREYEFETQMAEQNATATMMTTANTTQGTGGTNMMANFTAGTQNSAASAPLPGRSITRFGAQDEQSEDGDDGESMTAALRVDKEAVTITEVLAQIRQAMHHDDLEALREEFLNLGSHNFSLYKYINELTATKEAVTEEIHHLERLIAEESASAAEQRQLIKGLEDKLAHTEEQLEHIQRTMRRLRSATAAVLALTEEVYRHVGQPALRQENDGVAAATATTAEIGETGEAAQVCTEANLMSFLGTIEERAQCIQCAYQRHRALETRRAELAKGSKQGRPGEKDGSTALTHTEEKGNYRDKEDEDDEDNALSANTTAATDSARNTELPPMLFADELDVELVAPVAPSTGHNAVSAQRLVRLADLPSANLGGGAAENGGLLADLDEDRIISHEEIRRQLEARLRGPREGGERIGRAARKEGHKEGVSHGRLRSSASYAARA